jgi:murein DD-endopeptidase MepM/ murein hydrolase activator NlpD
VRDNYQRGQTTYLHVLLQSRTLHELLSRNYYVRHIVRSDAGLIEDIKRDLAQVEADKRRLEAQQREQDALEQEFESRKAEYMQDRTQQRELLNDVQAKRHEAEEELDDLEEEAHAMTARIRALSLMLRRREEALRRAALARKRQQERERRQRMARGQKPLPRSEPEEEDYTPRTFRGGFIRPVGGRITSGFGYRFHPILRRRKLHTGVDFGAPSGTPIRAAASGTVLLAGYSGGYGKCVIIYHGDGVTTLYGHCSLLNVSEGQEVRQGQVIARVGSTGMSTGPHLHFEVRRNGTPVRPF